MAANRENTGKIIKTVEQLNGEIVRWKPLIRLVVVCVFFLSIIGSMGGFIWSQQVTEQFKNLKAKDISLGKTDSVVIVGLGRIKKTQDSVATVTRELKKSSDHNAELTQRLLIELLSANGVPRSRIEIIKADSVKDST